jgi:hypothetical protein
VEIYNRGSVAIDMSGYFISDDVLNPTKWSFPPGTNLEPDSYIVVYEDVLGFGWSSTGVEIVMLTSPNGITGMDFYDMGPQQPDITEGRYPNGEGYWHFFADITPGSANNAPVAVGEIPGAAGLHMRGAWPNPFNPSTHIAFSLESSSSVRVSLHGLDGRLLRVLADDFLDSGDHGYNWNGRDDRGRALPSGIYFVKVATAYSSEATKLVLLK